MEKSKITRVELLMLNLWDDLDYDKGKKIKQGCKLDCKVKHKKTGQCEHGFLFLEWDSDTDTDKGYQESDLKNLKAEFEELDYILVITRENVSKWYFKNFTYRQDN